MAKRKGTSLSKLVEQWILSEVRNEHKRITVVEVSDAVKFSKAPYDTESHLQTDDQLYGEYLEYLYDKGTGEE